VAIVSLTSTPDTFVITGATTISDNTATLNGGGVYADLNNATFSVSDSSFILNEAANGGGIYARLDDMASLTLVETDLQENNAASGAGLYADMTDQSTLGVEGASFYDNEAILDGGGIYAILQGASTLELSDSSLVINDANNGDGAGLYAQLLSESTLLLQDTIFDGNEAALSGGGVYADVDNAILEVIRSDFLQNDAASGGGLFALANNNSTIVTDETTFELNAAGNGGGLYVDVSFASVQFDESSFVNNDAAASGGGVYAELRDGASVEIANSNITLNEALIDGGGLYAITSENANAILEVRESRITGNIATVGGGVRVDLAGAHMSANGSVFNIDRSRLDGNRAVSRGGGIFTAVGAGGQVTINESVITGNDAGMTLSDYSGTIPNAGGGMYAYLWTDATASTLTIAGTEISFNTAGQHGGGVALCTKRNYMSSAYSKLSVYNTTISGNKAGHTTAANDPGTGGGVHLGIFDGALQRLDARFQNSTITNNIADQGGGVWSFEPDPSTDSHNDVRLTNSIASANKKHNGAPSNLWGSFNIPLTVFNIIGRDNIDVDPMNIPTSRHDTYVDEVLLSDPPSGNIFTDDPKLAPLIWMGGPTKTHRPNNNSPALDAGSNDLAVIPFTTTLLTTDQRGMGFLRPVDLPGVVGRPEGPVDIGAYEIGLPNIIKVHVRDGVPPSHTPHDLSVIVGSGEQLRTVPVGGANTVNVWFSEHVTVNDGAITVTSAINGLPYSGSMFANSIQAGWQLPAGAVFTYDQVILRIDDAGVIGLAGLLDSEWSNPHSLTETGAHLSVFPSGNNIAGGDFEFFFTVLSGDFNHDNIVDARNQVIWNENEGTTSGATHSMGDANGDGAVNQADHEIWFSQFGLDFRVWPT
jgi:predicted outer membrane repeat protein